MILFWIRRDLISSITMMTCLLFMLSWCSVDPTIIVDIDPTIIVDTFIVSHSYGWNLILLTTYDSYTHIFFQSFLSWLDSMQYVDSFMDYELGRWFIPWNSPSFSWRMWLMFSLIWKSDLLMATLFTFSSFYKKFMVLNKNIRMLLSSILIEKKISIVQYFMMMTSDREEDILRLISKMIQRSSWSVNWFLNQT